LPYAALVAFYLVVFRVQIRSINDAVCAFNRHILNPAMMTLDRRHWYAAVLRHKGRRSGREYATPVTADPTEDGFVIPLASGKMSTGSRIFGWPGDAPSMPGMVPTQSVSRR
jgi:hypothetical protein